MFETTHNGITMQWLISRGRIHNAANPYSITGYVNGVCRMAHAVSKGTKEHCEKRVITRIEQIAKELEAKTNA